MKFDIGDLIYIGKRHGFRSIIDGEKIPYYRLALSLHLMRINTALAVEIYYDKALESLKDDEVVKAMDYLRDRLTNIF